MGPDYAFVTMALYLLTPTMLQRYYCASRHVHLSLGPLPTCLCTHTHTQHGLGVYHSLFGSQPRLNYRKVPGIKCLAWLLGVYISSHISANCPQAKLSQTLCLLFSSLLSNLFPWNYLKLIFTNMQMREKNLRFYPVLNSPLKASAMLFL